MFVGIETAIPPPRLSAARVPVLPRRVSGWLRRLKWWIVALPLGIRHFAPWIRWDRGPDLPNQAVLVDLSNRRFCFFRIEILAQDFRLVAGLPIRAGPGLFLFPAAPGRVWSGYSCRQAVWRHLSIPVERWIEGDRTARIRRWSPPWTAQTIRLRVTELVVWSLIAVATGSAWVFYYANASTLLPDLLAGRTPAVAYISVALLAATTFTFGGMMRKQLCIHMCWPRIQGAMMDEQTITAGYREWRGEPEGKHRRRRATAGNAEGVLATDRAALRLAGRPSNGRFDQVLKLAETPDGFAGHAALTPGNWRIDAATVENGADFGQCRSLVTGSSA
jgi:cytochrome c oxidase accessory protein FixG